MSIQWGFNFATLLVVATLLVTPSRVAAADPAAVSTGPSGPQVVCLSDQAVAQAGEHIVIRTWITDAKGHPANATHLTYAWSASKGSISGTAQATWVLPSDILVSDSDQASARLTVQGEGFGEATCEVVVLVAKVGETHATRSADLLEARALLLTGKTTPAGYGLYSYLLFHSPPADDEQRMRYLRTLEAWLRIAPVEELLTLHRRASSLNLTLVPVTHRVDLPKNLSDPKQVAEGARQVLDAYDFSNAKVLLQNFGQGAERRGPYLVSHSPVTTPEPIPPLVMDMSDATPRLAADWVVAYCRLAAQEPQERKWTRVALTKLNLNMRNVVAVMADDLPAVLNSLGQVVRLVNP